MTSAAPSLLRARRMPGLDGLRALAVLLVFGRHAEPRVFLGGWVGVSVFFALSGFLITTLLLNEHDRTGRVQLSRFYARRTWRLMPPLLVMVAVVLPLAMLLEIGRPLPQAAAALAYVMNFLYAFDSGPNALTHTWSLAVEEQFYLAWPAFLLFTLHRAWSGQRTVALLMVTGTVVTGGIYASGLVPNPDFLPTTHLTTLAAGIGLAFALRRSEHVLRWCAKPAVGLLGLALLLAGSMTLDALAPWLFWGGYTALSVLPVALIAHALAGRGLVAQGLQSRPASWLGLRSYGFYLWHFPVTTVLGHLGAGSALMWLVGLPVTLLLTVLSWRYVEQPCLRRRRSAPDDDQSSPADVPPRNGRPHALGVLS